MRRNQSSICNWAQCDVGAFSSLPWHRAKEYKSDLDCGAYFEFASGSQIILAYGGRIGVSGTSALMIRHGLLNPGDEIGNRSPDSSPPRTIEADAQGDHVAYFDRATSKRAKGARDGANRRLYESHSVNPKYTTLPIPRAILRKEKNDLDGALSLMA